MATTSMSMTARLTATSSGYARSSRRWTAISRRSKRSMASAIDTATADTRTRPGEPAPADAQPADPWPADHQPADPRPAGGFPARAGIAMCRAGINRFLSRFRWRLRWPRISPLTRRIVAVNVLPLALLALGFLYLGRFESTLIGQQIESLYMQSQIFAAALSEGAVLDSPDEDETLLPELSRQMMARLVEPTRTRARLFDRQGRLIADSRVLRGPGEPVPAGEPPAKDWLSRLTDALCDM